MNDEPPKLSYDFDGTTLPHLSGCDFVNACMTYIVDKDEFLESPFCSQMMLKKLDAIDMYLENNFDTNEKVVKFFTDFCNKYIIPNK